MFALSIVVCSLSASLALHILPCEPGMPGPLGCSNFQASQSRSPNFVVESDFRDRGLGDRGFGDRFGFQDQLFDNGIQDQFIGGGGVDFMLEGGGRIEPEIGLMDQSFGSDQTIVLDGTSGLSGMTDNVGSLIDPYPKDVGSLGSQGLDNIERFPSRGLSRLGKSGRRASTLNYPKGLGVSRRRGGLTSFPMKRMSSGDQFNSGMLGMGMKRRLGGFGARSLIGMKRGMNRGFPRSSMSYPKWGLGGGRNLGRMNRGFQRSYGFKGMSYKGFKGMGRGRLPDMGMWGPGMSGMRYPKGMAGRSSFSSKRSSGTY